tara:strand:- start:920 stop:1285 length:366 start_codon:yes stop_codon:yes gene_type:complete
MKISELKKYIREEIINTLSENIEDETKALQDYEAQLDQVIQKKQEAGLEEEEDKEPSDSEIKKNKSLAKYAEDLALLTKQMRSLAREYSKAEGAKKEDLLKTLKSKTKLKKELENILDKKL